MKDCIFCKIVKGEIKADKVYDDESTLAFLDVNPVSKGHTLIIPKKHYENIYDIPEEELIKVIKVAKKLAEEYKKEKGINAVNLLHASGKTAGQSVFHFHLHVIPRREDDGLKMWFF